MPFFKNLATVIFISALSFPLSAQESDLQEYDKNNDQRLNQEEFIDMLRELNWFSAWDINDNGFVSMEEFRQGLVAMYPDKDLYSYERYLAWDLNADHYIKDEEFWIGMYKLYDLDGNNYVDQKEFSTMRFEGEMDDRSRAAE